MWIGESSSPNKFYTDERYQNQNKVSVQDIFDQHNRGEELPESTFIQFNTCPWCKDESLGSVDQWEIQRVQSTVAGYEVPKLVEPVHRLHARFTLGFRFRVDEDLMHPPTILLGTVDKMVQLAHNHSAKSIQHGGYERVGQLNSRRMFGFSPGPLPQT